MYVCGTLWSTFYRCLYVDIPAFCQEIRLALNLQLYYSATLWKTFNGFTSSLLFALYTEFINLNSCLGCCIAVLSLLQWHILGWGYGVYQNRSNMDIYYSHASLYTHQKYSGFTFLSCIIRFFHFVSPLLIYWLRAANKYNKAGYLTLRERIARLNTHSIAKKTTRLSRLFMHETGIVPKVSAWASSEYEISSSIWDWSTSQRNWLHFRETSPGVCMPPIVSVPSDWSHW